MKGMGDSMLRQSVNVSPLSFDASSTRRLASQLTVLLFHVSVSVGCIVDYVHRASMLGLLLETRTDIPSH